MRKQEEIKKPLANIETTTEERQWHIETIKAKKAIGKGIIGAVKLTRYSPNVNA